MRLSILDQAPISSNQTAQEALVQAMKLAQAGEELGYTRYWIAEHHDLTGLACSVPEVMLGYIGAKTNRIRLGSGAVLLPHYRPYKVAEIYNMLATLFPGRIDIGIGRAPGGSAEATNALSENFLQKVWSMPNLVKELLQFLDRTFPAEHEFAKVSAAPIPAVSPEPWLLGTSKKSALLAAENGMNYAFGQFVSDNDAVAIVNKYKEGFTPRNQGETPQIILTVSAICADTDERAEEIALSTLIWSLQRAKGEAGGVPSIAEAKKYLVDKQRAEELQRLKPNMIIGGPQRIKNEFLALQEKTGADEIMIVTITHSPEDRIHSYKLIADVVLG